MVAIRQILSAALVLVSCSQVAAEQSLRLDRNDLLQFRGADGQLHRVATPAEWQNRRADILQGMQDVMGTLPSEDRRVPLDVKVEDETLAETYVRRLISYQSEPGSRTPAYLCIPNDVLAGEQGGSGPLPASDR